MIVTKKQAGFTLFEMVIAISIFALMGVIAFSGLGDMIKVGSAVSVENTRLSQLQFAMVYFKRDWTQVSPRKIRNNFGDEESNIIIDSNIITFTRSGWSNLLGHKRSSLQRVQYLLEDKNFVRRHWRSLDQGIGEEPISVVLMENVAGLEINFQNGAGQAIEVWPVLDSNQSGKPIVLAITLSPAGMGDITRYMEVSDALL
ncbi:MAG: general secretion pathway protein J [Gammaproteobacteria bacterium]|jgi:general secretion pathway protein J